MRMSWIVLFVISFLSMSAHAYREDTHQDLSEEALKASNVAIDSSLLQDLGLEAFENEQTFPTPNNINERKIIRDIIRDGAKFEDGGTRALSHFYNPITNQGLSAGNPSPDWAIEDNGDVSHVTAGDQEYSYKEAMNYFHLALTSQTEEVRNQNWGKLFQTLGQVIHHVQDMAQPDHARNDAHCDTPWCALIGQYEPSWYEEYTNDHKGDTYFTNLMSGNSYPIPSFPTAREYWTTRATDSAVASRRGMADYTNRNFVSKDTIFQFNNGSIVTHSEFPNPVPNITPVTVSIADQSIKGAQGQAVCDNIKARSIIPFPPSACYMDFVSTPVNDAITGASGTNDRAATYSIFDKKLQDHNIDAIYIREDGSIDTIDRSFTLNEFNFKAAHNYLIPRAVAYSAGLINHFFRGKIDMKPNPNGEGWVIQNLSDEEMEGTFTLYCDDMNGNRSEVVNGSITTTAPLVANGELEFSGFDVSGCISTKTLVFKGRIGEEGRVTEDGFQLIVGKILSLDKILVITSDMYLTENKTGRWCDEGGSCYGWNGTWERGVIKWYAAISGNRIIKKWMVEYFWTIVRTAHTATYEASSVVRYGRYHGDWYDLFYSVPLLDGLIPAGEIDGSFDSNGINNISSYSVIGDLQQLEQGWVNGLNMQNNHLRVLVFESSFSQSGWGCDGSLNFGLWLGWENYWIRDRGESGQIVESDPCVNSGADNISITWEPVEIKIYD